MPRGQFEWSIRAEYNRCQAFNKSFTNMDLMMTVTDHPIALNESSKQSAAHCLKEFANVQIFSCCGHDIVKVAVYDCSQDQ